MKQFPGGLQNFLKQAQQMQSKMAKVQEELATTTVEGTAGGGGIKVTATCKPSLQAITIDKELSQDVDMLQDMVIAAVNDALKKAEEIKSREMEKVSGGLSMPGLF